MGEYNSSGTNLSQDDQARAEIERLLSDLIRIGLADVDRPAATPEYQILAKEVMTSLLSESSPQSLQLALQRLRDLCRDYDIE